MAGIEKISRDDIEQHVTAEGRQYLVGNLQLPQPLLHLHDEDVEVGISVYKEFTADKPHIHPITTEYQMVLHGYSEIKDLHRNEVTKLFAGDFFIVRRGTAYAQKSQANTRILFFKYPSGNDKTLVEIDEETKVWLRTKI